MKKKAGSLFDVHFVTMMTPQFLMYCIELFMWCNRPTRALGHLNVEVSRSHIIRHTYALTR